MRTTHPILILAMLALFAGVSCCGSKKHSAGLSEDRVISLAPSFEVSALTRKFLSDVEEELRVSGLGFGEYNPSNSLVERYGLLRRGDSVSVSGFVKVDDGFEAAGLHAMGGSLGEQVGTMRTLTLPLSRLKDFLHLRGVSYFELATKSQNR